MRRDFMKRTPRSSRAREQVSIAPERSDSARTDPGPGSRRAAIAPAAVLPDRFVLVFLVVVRADVGRRLGRLDFRQHQAAVVDLVSELIDEALTEQEGYVATVRAA